MSDELKASCNLVGFPETWAQLASTSASTAAASLNDTINKIIRTHGCGSVIVSHEALSNFTASGISCLKDPQLAPLVASAVKEKVWRSLEEEREELLNIFRDTFQADLGRDEISDESLLGSSGENISLLLSAAARYQGHIHMLQSHFSRAEGSYSLPVDVRRIFNNFTQDESQVIRSYCEELHRSQLLKKAAPRDPSHPQKILFLATFTRLMELDKEKIAKAHGVASDDLTTARTVEGLCFSWIIESWMELKMLASTGGRVLHDLGEVVWHPLARVQREWKLRFSLLEYATSALSLVGDAADDNNNMNTTNNKTISDLHGVQALVDRTPKLSLRSIAALLYEIQPHFRFDPLGSSDVDFSIMSENGDDEEAAVRRIVQKSNQEKAWREIVLCIQPAQLQRQETVEAERAVITQKYALNAFSAIVNISRHDPFHSYHFYCDENDLRQHVHSADLLSAIRNHVRMQCGAADALHTCLARFVNRKPTHPFLEEVRQAAAGEFPTDTTIVNPLHPPFEIDFMGILSEVVADGMFDFGLLRYKNTSGMSDVLAVRKELGNALWAPIVSIVGREADLAKPAPSLLYAGPLLVRLMFWFVYCAFFNHKQVACYNHYYMDLASHAISTIFAYIAEHKVNSVLSFVVKSSHERNPTAHAYRHHRGDSPSSMDFLPFAIVHATLLCFFRTFPSNIELFTEKTFVGPASLLMFELFLGRRGVPSSHYTTLRRRMFEHPAIRIVVSTDTELEAEAEDEASHAEQKKDEITSPRTVGGDTDEFIKTMINKLNSHATSISPVKKRRPSESCAPSTDLSLSPTDEAVLGETRKRIALFIASNDKKNNAPLARARPSSSSDDTLTSKSNLNSKSHTSAHTNPSAAIWNSPMPVDFVRNEIVSEVVKIMHLAIIVNREHIAKSHAQHATNSLRPATQERMTPFAKRRATMYPKVKSLTSAERKLLDLSRGEIAKHSVLTRSPTKKNVPLANPESLNLLTNDESFNIALNEIITCIVDDALKAAAEKVTKKVVNEENDLFVDEDFHIFNTRLVSDPDYAREVIKERGALMSSLALGNATGDGADANSPLLVSNIGRAKRLNALRERINETFDPSHAQKVKGVRSGTALNRLALHLAQISMRIATRRRKILSKNVTPPRSRFGWGDRVGSAGGSMPGTPNQPLAGRSGSRTMIRKSVDSEVSGSDGGSRPPSTSAQMRRKTSSAIFSSSRRLSLYFNSDSHQGQGGDLELQAISETNDDDTLDSLELELQSLMIPIAAVQCCKDAAIVVEQLYKEDGLSSTPATNLIRDGNFSGLSIQDRPSTSVQNGGTASIVSITGGGTLADHLFARDAVMQSSNSDAKSSTPFSNATVSRRSDIIASLPHHQPFQRIGIHDLPSFTSGLTRGGAGNPNTTAVSQTFLLEKDPIDNLFARPKSVAHLSKASSSRPRSTRSLTPLGTVSVLNSTSSKHCQSQHLSTNLPKSSCTNIHNSPIDPSIDPSFELKANRTVPSPIPLSSIARPTSRAESVPAAKNIARGGSLNAVAPASAGIGLRPSSSLQGSVVSASKPPLPVIFEPVRGGNRHLSPPRVAASSNVAIEEINLYSCSPSVSRSAPQNGRGARVHMLGLTCQPNMPAPGAASKLAMAIRQKNEMRFNAEDRLREELRQREMADLRSTERSQIKLDMLLEKELQDPLRRTEFIDTWIAHEPPKVSAVDPRDEVTIRQIAKGETDSSGRIKLMWEGSRAAVDAKLNALELKEIIRGAEMHVNKSTRKGKKHH